MSCGVGRRHGSGPLLLWLWCRLAATARIWPPCLGTSICCGSSPKKNKRQKKKNYNLPVISYFSFGVILIFETWEFMYCYHFPLGNYISFTKLSVWVGYIIYELHFNIIMGFFFFFCHFRATPARYESSQAGGWIRAVAAGLYHRHSSAESKPCL